MTTLHRIFTLPLRFYRKYLSPLKGTRCCRFVPSCSAYAIEAIEEWGIFAGGAMAFWRLLRCNPFGRGGYDPVPKRKKKRLQGNKTTEPEGSERPLPCAEDKKA